MASVSFFGLGLALAVLAGAARADDLPALIARSEASFERLPEVVVLPEVTERCGGGVLAPAIYCTSENAIYLSAALEGPEAAYALAHLYGHALQVRYGLADIALAAIRAEPAEEAAIRSRVTRQVECLAGVLLARAGIDVPPLDVLFEDEPMTDAHWGRSPVRSGPRVSIGLAARAEWFARGQAAADPAICAVDGLLPDLIVEGDAG